MHSGSVQRAQECWGGFSHALLVWSLAATAVVGSAITFKEYAVRNGVKLPLLMASQVVEQVPGAMTTAAERVRDEIEQQDVKQGSSSEPRDDAKVASAVEATPDTNVKTISVAPKFLFDENAVDADFVGPPEPDSFINDEQLRWFHGRPIRPSKVLWMRVTGYSPDEKSCGTSADGRTATMHCVTTNAFLLVAADPNVLPYGSMLTIPGYAAPEDAEKVADVDITANWANERAQKPGAEGVVPVLDCGGAIKGFRLDLLFPTHEAARAWGTKMLPVTVWEYADGKPKPNPRRLR